MKRSRNNWLVAFIAFFAVGAAGQTAKPDAKPEATPPDADVVKISTNIIQLDVTVVDSGGRIVKDIRPDEIEIYENGKRQPITNFSFVSVARPLSRKDDREPAKSTTGEAPIPTAPETVRAEQVRRTIAIVIDDLSLSAESIYHTRLALRKFVNEQIVEGDLVAIIRTGAGTGTLQQFTSDKTILNAAVERVRWNPSGGGGFSAFEPIAPSFAELVEAETGKATASASASSDAFNATRSDRFALGTLGALKYIVEGMEELPGRKSVIMFSDGWRMFSDEGWSQSTRIENEVARLIESANRAGAVFYPIDARGVQYTGITAADQLSIGTASNGTITPTPRRMAAVMGQRNAILQDTQAGMDTLAKETGGFSRKNSNDLGGGIRKALEDQSYYLVAYEPDSDTFDPTTRKFNKIEVKVLRKGLTARYRSGFFNFADEQVKRPLTAGAGSPTAQLQKALASPFIVNDIALSLNPVYGNDAKDGDFVQSLLHIKASDLKFVDDPNGKKRAEFSVIAMSFGAGGAAVDQIFKDYTIVASERIYQKLQDEGFVYYFNFPIKKPGAYQYRVALRDKLAGKIGSANQFIQVPNVKKGHHLSGILLQSYTAQQWANITADPSTAAATSDPMKDTSLRRFRTGTVLRYDFEVYNARGSQSGPSSLTAKIRVFREGKMVLDGNELPIDIQGQADPKRIKSGGAIQLLNEMEPGDYILQIIVTENAGKDKRSTAARAVEFELTR